MSETSAVITYNGSQISLFLGEMDDESVNLTDIAITFKKRESIKTWLRNKQTIEFLNVWERKYNLKYDGAQLSTVLKLVRERTLSIKQWIDLTNAKGIYTRTGDKAGTYAHKDIALHFSRWISPEFELHLVEEIKRLKEIERQKNSLELLNHEQVLALVQLKEIFKYVTNQIAVEDAHKDVYAARSNSTNPFSEFHKWRNEILDMKVNDINDRIRQYYDTHHPSLTAKALNKSKREKILLLDSYDSVRNAVWDFLQMRGDLNALSLATLVGRMIRTEQGQVFRKNEDNLFDKKNTEPMVEKFTEMLAATQEVKTARELLAYREEIKKRPIPMHESDFTKENHFDTALRGLLAIPPKKKK